MGYVDLLGTSESALGEEAQTTLRSLDQALGRARKQSDIEFEAGWWHTSWFSDNLCIAAPLPDDRSVQESVVGFVLVALAWLQWRLTIDGFCVRGGLCVGEMFSDDSITFGPALVEAVRLEHRSNFPRIALSEDLVDIVNYHFQHYGDHDDNPFYHELMRSPDGTVFVSCLGVSQEADSSEESRHIVDLHKAAISQQLQADSEPKVREKYEWVAGYHDAYCARFFPGDENLKVHHEGRPFVPYVPAPTE